MIPTATQPVKAFIEHKNVQVEVHVIGTFASHGTLYANLQLVEFPEVLIPAYRADSIRVSPSLVISIEDITSAISYWDCECEKNYIHSKGQSYCPACNAHQEDQPDSNFEEVWAMLNK